MNLAQAIKEIKLGKVEYRLDKDSNMHLSIGRVSFETSDLVDNLKALINQLIKVKPSAVKGVYVKTAVVSTTMGPSIKFNFGA